MERAEQKTEQNVIYFLFLSQPSTQPAIPICLIWILVQTYIVRVVSYFFQEMKQKCFTSKAPLKSWWWSFMLLFFSWENNSMEDDSGLRCFLYSRATSSWLIGI